MIRLLVVDDNRPSRELVADILGAERFEMIEAADGISALAAARANRLDMVILDIALPGMDGLAVARELRQDPLLRELPILALTANAMPGEEERARAAGFSAFLTKPVRSFELRRLVEALLGEGHA
jgi:CheY-like chemotaxis protein